MTPAAIRQLRLRAQDIAIELTRYGVPAALVEELVGISRVLALNNTVRASFEQILRTTKEEKAPA